MSAAARAEARRKAILSRGSDRLAKLTTSARGEDAPAYMNDAPLASSHTANLKTFVGEETMMPTPPNRVSPSPSPRARNVSSSSTGPGTADSHAHPLGFNAEPDPSVWSEEQQRQFMEALFEARTLSAQSDSAPAIDLTQPPMDNPFATMLMPRQGRDSFTPPPGTTAGKAAAEIDVPPSPTLLQKLMPVIHLLIMWCLLGYFVLYKEPQVRDAQGGNVDGPSIWRRWAELGRSSPIAGMTDAFKIQVVPFFWAFTTVQLVLHSVRVFSGFDAVQPPTLLTVILPHFPPPFPTLIMNSLKYWQMGSLFLDDLAGLVVGIGFIILFSGWLSG